MTYGCAKILKELNNIAKTTDVWLTFVSDAPYICLYEDTSVYFDYSKTKYKNEISAIINELARTEYLVISQSGFQFALTYKGIHPYQVGWQALKRFLFKSVTIPIVVSVVTALITLWLRGLL